MKINMYEAKTQLSKLVEAAERGEEVIIARSGQPRVRLVPITNPARRRFGIDAGIYRVPDDFDLPLSDDLIKQFET